MTEDQFRRDYPHYEPVQLHDILTRCLAELHIAALKEADSTPCSAVEHRATVFRRLRDWVRKTEGQP